MTYLVFEYNLVFLVICSSMQLTAIFTVKLFKKFNSFAKFNKSNNYVFNSRVAVPCYMYINATFS